MKTPIYDFVQTYLSASPLRLHMPGHKGKGPLGVEQSDITEIDGADVLYHESGIIKQSQDNASYIFGSSKTLYSTEGATLAIRAMLALVCYYAKEIGKDPILFAGRNAHKSFMTSCALLDLDPIWIDDRTSSLLSCAIDANALEELLAAQEKAPIAVYITTPDYLGNVIDVSEIAKVCHKYGALLLVDNAHGAYLHFLPDPIHPLDLGADLVCDSAHKTLPVLTGGAYLHISKGAPHILTEFANSAISVFSSTSPSYLILQSLDLCNAYLNQDYCEKLYQFSCKIVDVKKELKKIGYQIVGNEPLKITILTKSYGYRGDELAELLSKQNIYVEFADPDYLVMMLTPEQGFDALQQILNAFSSIKPNAPILSFPPKVPKLAKSLTPREAILSPGISLPVEQCVGRILTQPSITCPPAVPIAICGERITPEHLIAFQYYGITDLTVKK